MRPLRVCSCGHEIYPAEWRTLELVRSRACPDGIQEVPAYRDEPAYKLELRLCSKCGTSLAVQVESYDLELGAWAISASAYDGYASRPGISPGNGGGECLTREEIPLPVAGTLESSAGMVSASGDAGVTRSVAATDEVGS